MPKSEVDKFLSESNRAEIDVRLLIQTTDGLSRVAERAIRAQEKPVRAVFARTGEYVPTQPRQNVRFRKVYVRTIW